MQNTLYQLASRVDLGSPIQRRRQYRMQQLNQQNNKQPIRFDAHLRNEYRQGIKPDTRPPEAVDPKTDQEETVERPPAASSQAMRTAYRKSYMQAFRHLRQENPEAHQSQIGWVMSRVSRALTDNPFMAKQDVQSLVDSLVAGMPVYEPEA